MTMVAGASRYYSAALYANQEGSSDVVSTSNLLSESYSAVDILDIGRQDNGIGLSSYARSLNRQFLEQTSTGFNTIFSLSTSQMSSSDTMMQSIKALRASLPQSKIADYVLESEAAESGSVVDEEA